MTSIVILHTNDIHGRVEELARIATLVAQIRAENAPRPVFYFDLGDSEEYARRLSGLTKGAAMHRLLEAAGCDVTVVGNAVLARHGPKAVAEETTATGYPHLLANVHYADGAPIAGTQPTALLDAGALTLGLIGVTAEFDNYERFFGLQAAPLVPLIKEHADALRAAGADAVILLSHRGIDTDREVAAGLDGELALILGGHSHTLLPQGEWVGDVLLAQAGEYGEYLGRVLLDWDGARLRPVEASALPVTEAIPPSARVKATVAQIEKELDAFLGEIVCALPHGLDLTFDRECALGNLLADALRAWSDAEVGLAVPGPTFTQGLAAGPLPRQTLWAASPGTGNPGVAVLTGAQLEALVWRGLDVEFAVDKHPALRGQGRGLMHLSGATVRDGQLLIDGRPPQPARRYRVAASDFEFEPVWGYADESWELAPQYDVDVIMRDVVEAHLRAGEAFPLVMGRLGGVGGDAAE